MLLRFVALFLLTTVGCTSVGTASPAEADSLHVAAAADLQFAFKEIADLYQKQTGQQVVLTFGSTGQLEQQVENGAPFDLLAAADISYIGRLRAKGLVVPETQQLYAGAHRARRQQTNRLASDLPVRPDQSGD